MFNFDWGVSRDKEKTIITLNKLNLAAATYMLYNCRKKFGNWTSDEKFTLEWLGAGINSTISITIYIPAPTDPRHTRDSFTKEWCSGYFSGIIETMKDKSDDELLDLCKKMIY